MNKLAIVWLRRDLRLADHPALHTAISNSRRVVLVYIHDTESEAPWQPGAASRWWLHHSLHAFSSSLQKHGTQLVVRQGASLETLLAICEETDADSVYWNRLYEPAVIRRDSKIKTALQQQGIATHSFNGALLREPWEISKEDGTMYRVYTPFSKKYLLQPELDPPLDAPHAIPSPKARLASDPVDSLHLLPKIRWDSAFSGYWTPGENGATAQLDIFAEHGVLNYTTGRDLPAEDGVSRLAPHLHFGEISPRSIWHAIRFHGEHAGDMGAENAAERVLPYLKQLIWRDFAHHILYHVPTSIDQPFNKKFDGFEWDKNQQIVEAWQQGQTGIPLVDAGMRQLWQTGWMHNRIRMLVASVLTKNGLVHWLEGAHWFWDTLLDANLANNTMGWQWVAGCGVDAAPYYRIFSPARQGERFDKEGAYVRRWVPELAGLPSKIIHQPWLARPEQLSTAGITLGKNYPEPVVDLAASRKVALDRYKSLAQPL